ncbi:MAG: hypothetical protein KDH96_13250, partial [Candidatus Riesia sp.]|nr:hypothetical protein [Candidatus Riesia sp.]
MLPINNKAAKGCTPISSSCVIWNGPDLPCIDLCKGDNIDTVIYEIATELCNLLDLVDLQNYENIPENINDAQDLIQALIDNLSNEVECCDNEAPASEQIITMASCFWYTNNTNDTVTTATLEEYTRMIGAKLCDLVTTVNNNTTAIQQLNDQVNQNTANYQELTDDIATGALMPQFASRTSGETGTTNDGLRALENSYLNLKDATGSADALYKAALAAGSNLNTENRLDGQGKMNSILGWVDSVSSLADSVNNLWLTVLDARKGLNALSCTNSVVAECRDISLKFRADITADLETIKIYLDGSTIPSGFRDCNSTGSSL